MIDTPWGRAAACLALTVLFAPNRAWADERAECASAADQAQQLRDEGKYRRAREQLLVCARESCPGPIKKDCSDWLKELDGIAPSVVVAAKEGGRDLSDVKVSMDNVVIAERLDGKPIAVDLGEHVFRFEYQGQTKEERVLIGAGQKGRNIAVVFPAKDRTPPPPPPTSEGSIVPALVVGGIGVVALGSFAFFGLSGKSDVDDLQGCKPHCEESAVDKARSKLIIADISLAVGVVALGVATYMMLTRPKVEAPSVKTGLLRVDVAPTAGGAAGVVEGRF